TSSVNKSSSPTNNSNQQDTQPTTNFQPTSEPPTHTFVHAEEKNDNQAEEEDLQDDKFTNPFCTPAQELAEFSSHNLEQVHGNPSKLVQTRRQLATDPEMCMFALTVSTAEPKNVKEAMADSAWIEAMQEELYQFDRLQVYRLRKDPYGLKQAPKAWYDELSKFLTSKGFTKGDKLVSWMSKKPDCTAMSSANTKYVALSASCAQVMWMRTQLQDYGLYYNNIPLYCDSQSAIAISCNPVQHFRTKHIHTRYHFIKEQVENGIIELYFVRTEYQLANMFTKALLEDRFKYLVRRIGMRCLTPAELEVLAREST
nr:retrovirus-related Pol polyprotein from transposon TNT 1-94 [Tanacetum cinerariifolium]